MFSFNSHVYYLTRGFITSTRAFNLATLAFSLLTRGCELVTRGFELVTLGFELVTRGFELVTRGFELVTRISELVTRVLLFHIQTSHKISLFIFIFTYYFHSFWNSVNFLFSSLLSGFFSTLYLICYDSSGNFRTLV